MSFWKKWNCTSRFGECNLAFWKTHKCKLIPNWMRKTVWLLINNINMKNLREGCFELYGLWTLFSVLWARLTAGGFNYHAIRKKLRHPGRALDLKIKDLIGYLWTSLFIDQSECLLYYFFLHSITSFLHCVKEKLHCSQPIRIE